ncbi:MAG: 4Fe-4S binding protein [Clostridiaceae bacterium]|nr:4Fe-4S binding protein [Clostridiaceae bacterium]
MVVQAGGKAVIERQQCFRCRACTEICPTKAIAYKK